MAPDFFSLIFVISGLAMIAGSEDGNTFLCLNAGCKGVQGFTLLGLAASMTVVGGVKISRK